MDIKIDTTRKDYRARRFGAKVRSGVATRQLKRLIEKIPPRLENDYCLRGG